MKEFMDNFYVRLFIFAVVMPINGWLVVEMSPWAILLILTQLPAFISRELK